MEVLTILAGATAVAAIYNLIAKIRREQIESQSPYEHALKNASEKNFQLRAELSTLHALESIETDNERLQNEIETIVSKGEREAPEDVYDDDIEDILSDLNAILEQEERSRQKVKQLRERGLLEVNLFGRTSVDKEAIPNTGVSAEEAALNHGRAFQEFGEGVHSHTEHFVSPGDTLTRIARKYDVMIYDIIVDNELLVFDDLDAPGVIRPGQILKIRDNLDGVSEEKATECDSEYERLTNAYEERTLIEEIANKTVGSLQLHVEWAKQLGKDDEEVRKILAKVSEETDEIIEQTREEIRRLRKETE